MKKKAGGPLCTGKREKIRQDTVNESVQNPEQNTHSQAGAHEHLREHKPVHTKVHIIEEKDVGKFDWKLLRRFLVYLIAHKLGITGMYILAMFNVAANTVIPILIKIGMDTYIPGKDLRGLLILAAVMAGVLLVLFVSARGQGVLLNRIGYKVLFNLRRDLFNHLQELSFRFYDKQRTGKIITRLTSDVQVLEELLRTGLDTLFVDIFLLLAIMIAMFVMDIRLSLVIFITVPLFGVLVFYLRAKMVRIARGLQRKLSSVNAFLNESISGIKVIRAFAREDENVQSFQAINGEYYAQAKIFYPLVAMYWQGVVVLFILGTALVLLGGGVLLSLDMISLGVIAAFLAYVNRFFDPMQKLSNLMNQLSRAMASCERIFEILDTRPDIQDSPAALQLVEIRGQVRFQDVDFGYNTTDTILRGVSFEVSPGETVALVGPTGAGKTTIVNLLCRFYDPVRGAVYVDGHDLRSLSQTAYRSSLAIVIQDTTIFSGSVLDNIRYGKPQAGRQEVEAIVLEMGIMPLIQRLPEGLDTEIGERGASLSLGERQLIAIARALLRDPRILILDEASAYLDSSTELLVQNAMLRLRENRTNFVIAHRLSTIREADLILVIDDGKIVESGSHAELVARNGYYTKLLKTQEGLH